jgi:hypothetical protein
VLTLDVLSGPQARQLLARHLGERRVTSEIAAVAELTALCAGLPLALSITAARAWPALSFEIVIIRLQVVAGSPRWPTGPCPVPVGAAMARAVARRRKLPLIA